MFLVNFIYILGVGTLATWQEIAQTIEVEEIGMLMSSVTSATSMVTSLVNAMPPREFQIKKKIPSFYYQSLMTFFVNVIFGSGIDPSVMWNGSG